MREELCCFAAASSYMFDGFDTTYRDEYEHQQSAKNQWKQHHDDPFYFVIEFGDDAFGRSQINVEIEDTEHLQYLFHPEDISCQKKFW